MIDGKWLFLINSKSLSSADCIFDLSTVKVAPREPVILFVVHSLDFGSFDSNHFFDKGLPHCLLRFAGEFSVAKCDVDS